MNMHKSLARAKMSGPALTTQNIEIRTSSVAAIYAQCTHYNIEARGDRTTTSWKLRWTDYSCGVECD